MDLIWSNKSASATPAARFVESESGDILSPKIAPETTAPAVIAAGMPNPYPMPMNATPKVAPVVHELPVATDEMAQIRHTENRNMDGDNTLSP